MALYRWPRNGNDGRLRTTGVHWSTLVRSAGHFLRFRGRAVLLFAPVVLTVQYLLDRSQPRLSSDLLRRLPHWLDLLARLVGQTAHHVVLVVFECEDR